MWTRFTFEDIRIIAHYLGTLTSLFTVALLIPLITALVFQEWEPATRYFLAAGISLTIGSLLRMAQGRSWPSYPPTSDGADRLRMDVPRVHRVGSVGDVGPLRELSRCALR